METASWILHLREDLSLPTNIIHNDHKSIIAYTGCPKKNAPMFELAISPPKMVPEIKVR